MWLNQSEWAWASKRNLLGGILVITASFISNVSTNVQKRSHNREQLLPVAERRSYTRRKLWWLGMTGVICGGVMDFIALGIASQTLVASLGGAASLLTNATVSYMWNREPLYTTDLVGTLAVICGAGLFACTAQEAKIYSLTELESFFVQPVFVVTTILQCTLVVLLLSSVRSSRVYTWKCYLLNWREESKSCKHRSRRLWYRLWWWWRWWGDRPRIATIGQPVPNVEVVDRNDDENIDDSEDAENAKCTEAVAVVVESIDKYIYAFCSGMVGAQSVLLGGCASKVILELWVRGWGRRSANLMRPTPILFIVGMIISVVLQTHFLNRSMILGDNISIIPTFNAFWTLFGVSGGVVFYQQGSIEISGVVLMVCGVTILSQHKSRLEENAIGHHGHHGHHGCLKVDIQVLSL